MNAPFRIDWKNPDYAEVFRQRMLNLQRLRDRPELWDDVKAYYAAGNYADFINDWGVTYDPRNPEIGLPAIVPMVLFDRQREWVDWIVRRWRARRPGICEKSRDVGVSWLAMGLSCTLCLHHDDLQIGCGSRQKDLADKIGFMKALLPKARMFMAHLPEELRGGWVEWRDAPEGIVRFPDTGSSITAEGGDDIGRGDRASIYFVDEAAHLKRPHLIEASLSQTTNCRIDMSSVKGMANPFAQKRWRPNIGDDELFIFDWREDPRKDDAWYAKQCEELDPVVVAQEIDRDYSASVRGVVIPGEWVRAAIDARDVLGIAPAGVERLSFDVADEGEDKNAICIAKGIDVVETEEWTGEGSDIFESTEYVFDVADDHGIREFRYDADGIGAGVRSDARVINERRAAKHIRIIRAIPYRGSEAVVDPEAIVEGTATDGSPGRTNEDYFKNHKAQSWWALRRRFQKTFRWVQWVKTKGEKGGVAKPDEIISLSSKNPSVMKLVAELSQVTYRQNEIGQIVIEKKPPGTKSPNQADAVVENFAPMPPEPVEVTESILAQIARSGRRR